MCHMPQKKIFKKSQNFEIVSKNGSQRQKNEVFGKICSNLERPSKMDTKHETHAPKRFLKKSKV